MSRTTPGWPADRLGIEPERADYTDGGESWRPNLNSGRERLCHVTAALACHFLRLNTSTHGGAPLTRVWLVGAKRSDLFKHDVSRLYEVPYFLKVENGSFDVFRKYLLPMQASRERQMVAIEYAAEVTVTV